MLENVHELLLTITESRSSIKHTMHLKRFMVVTVAIIAENAKTQTEPRGESRCNHVDHLLKEEICKARGRLDGHTIGHATACSHMSEKISSDRTDTHDGEQESKIHLVI